LTMVMAIGFGVALAFSQMSQWHTMTASSARCSIRPAPRCPGS
jgi:hypothetical protein